MMNTTPEISDNLVRKIQLLLNLAARSEGNEAEAAAAMSKAQELLAAYNLDLSTVQDKVVAGGTAQREADSKRDYARANRSAMYKWQRSLVQTIAEANYCRYWVEEARQLIYVPPSKRTLGQQYEAEENGGKCFLNVKRHKVLGRVANTTVMLIMVDYLMDTIERLLPYPQQERLSREANLWREGCADRLSERITAKAEVMRTPDYAKQGEAVYCTAIAVRDMAKAEEAGNYDAMYGQGAWARKLASQAKWDVEWEAGRAEREARRRLEAEREAQKLLAETPAQKAARQRREAAEARRSNTYWNREYAKQDKRDARKDTEAYRRGHAKANDIGLDSQLNKSAARKELA